MVSFVVWMNAINIPFSQVRLNKGECIAQVVEEASDQKSAIALIKVER